MIFKTGEKKSEVKNGVSRFTLSWLAFLIEMLAVVAIAVNIAYQIIWLMVITRVISVIVALFMYSQNRTFSLKITWIIFVLAFPVTGLMVYFLVGLSGAPRRMRKRYSAVSRRLLPILPENEDVESRLRCTHPRMANVSHYIHQRSGYPLYNNSSVTYYSDTNEAFDAQLKAVRSAKHFIFIEYYAIQQSGRWEEMYEILLKKKNEGVEVRIFYDDVGSLKFISSDFGKRLTADGISFSEFNHVTPIWSFFFNNRDHRKMTIVDGRVGFTGGYNLADEYFNITHPYGLWKDSGIRIEGEAVRSMTITFLGMWNATVNKGETENVSGYVNQDYSEYATSEVKGFVQPYADSPMDHELVGEDVYISLIDSAADYIWFVTPYLIMTEEMVHALSLAAKRGVDVRIIMPGIPDKKTIYGISRSYYHSIVPSGVRVFEYTPGFCHAKMCVTDDIAATCGSINLDYRSLVHHFENGCFYVDCPQVMDTKRDFMDMLSVSKEVTEDYVTERKMRTRLWQLLLRLIAPLL